MLDSLFQSIFSDGGVAASAATPGRFLLCLLTALVIGGGLAFVYTCRSRFTKSFVVTLALLPASVAVVILMVNGNIGAGVAVAGAFSLVRFRSIPGTAREIGAIFVAMAAGLAVGMGYLGYALLFSLVLALAMLAYNASPFGEKRADARERVLRIAVPEDLDYTGAFDDLFAAYTTNATLNAVKTAAMGTFFA